jgi:hypothetical protein
VWDWNRVASGCVDVIRVVGLRLRGRCGDGDGGGEEVDLCR